MWQTVNIPNNATHNISKNGTTLYCQKIRRQSLQKCGKVRSCYVSPIITQHVFVRLSLPFCYSYLLGWKGHVYTLGAVIILTRDEARPAAPSSLLLIIPICHLDNHWSLIALEGSFQQVLLFSSSRFAFLLMLSAATRLEAIGWLFGEDVFVEMFCKIDLLSWRVRVTHGMNTA